ncbi:MAG: SET domain-containing protein-lysine N-methyltransferase [Chlamydiota bacterium]
MLRPQIYGDPGRQGFSLANSDGRLSSKKGRSKHQRRIIFGDQELSPSQFREHTGVEYFSHLQFDDAENLQHVISQYPSYILRGNISRQAQWYGKFYCREIQEGYVAPISIRWVNDQVGYGVFAEKNLKKHQYVSEYTGKVCRRQRFLWPNLNAYCFSYPAKFWSWRSYMIDSKDKGNETRFINHSDSPNLEPLYALYNNVVHIILRVAKDVPQGSQLTFNYGKAYWRIRNKLPRTVVEGVTYE